MDTPTVTPASQTESRSLADMIARLEADRQRHAHAIREIDRVLEQVGQAVSALRRDPAPTHTAGDALILHPQTPPAARPKRGRFAETGDASVLNFIRREGRPTTAQINAHWRAEGRKGTANVILLKLLKTRAIVRQLDPNVRGSRYIATSEASATAQSA